MGKSREALARLALPYMAESFRGERMHRAHVILAIIAAYGLAACNAPIDQKQSSRDSREQVQIAQQVFSLGEAVRLAADPAMEVRLIDVEHKPFVGAPGYTSSADDSGTLIAIRYIVKNKSNHAVAAQTLWPQLTLIDGKGVQYQVDGNRTGNFATEYTFQDNDARFGSLVSPGMTVHRYAVFQVAADEFDPKTWRVVIGSTDGPQLSLAKMGLLEGKHDVTASAVPVPPPSVVDTPSAAQTQQATSSANTGTAEDQQATATSVTQQ